jgi:alpha-tubulin suppressor-like RCC1 family protein
LLKGIVQRNRRVKFRWSILLAAGLSLVLATQTLAAPESGVKAVKPLILTVTAADYHSVAYTSNGDVWYWGGIADVIKGKHTFRDNEPKLMKGLKDVAAIQSHHHREVILKKDGTVWEWGSKYNPVSPESTDGFTEFPEPKQIKGLSHIVKISASSVSSAIDKDGSVWVWHPDHYFSGPHKLENMTNAEDISVNDNGELHILKKDGTVWKWSAYIERNANTSYKARKIESLRDIIALSSGHGRHNFAIKKDGTVWGWGGNSGEVLGLPIPNTETETVDIPTQIKSLSDVASITTGWMRTLVLKNDGTLWVMGYDVGEYHYFLKHGPELRRIDGLKNVTSVAMGYNHAVAATEDGKLWAWGSNITGQLGDASFKDSTTPILVNLLP